ncbi:MAG: hypothetical protein JJE35_07425 [Thermoleophilia bacterium]|nr:hypothetical protein [Thermoleophilia bacterium]
MDFKSLFKKGKKTVEERGGAESVKADAGELKDIAGSNSSLTDKAQDPAEAIKDPGAPRGAQ